ncbi:MAG: sulfatase [Puniceicoccaceae bacterium]
MRFTTALLLLCFLIPSVHVSAEDPSATRPNILFIAIDDLRPEILEYGHEEMVTPNMDRLANRSLLFERAYCMVPTCGASRASLMTGIRPTKDRFVSFDVFASEDAPGIVTLNTHLKENGYHTVSLGKVFHHRNDNESGWSEPPWRAGGGHYANPENEKKMDGWKNGQAYEREDVPDNTYRDGKLAEEAIRVLQRLSKKKQPFFLSVGFTKPHLPFVAPEKYWALYDGKVELPDNYYAPENVPDEAMHPWGELRNYTGIPKKGVLPRKQARTLIHGYRACVTYVDTQIGRILDEMDSLGLTGNTVLVLWGDHGWNLGEHTLWCKHCCFENALRAPLIISAPMLDGFESATRTGNLTEFIDIYPTLCDLAGIDKPQHLEGTSLTDVLKDPDTAHKEFAISRFKSGDTIRTNRYRYSQYTDNKGKVVARMLYDHDRDPGENHNIAGNPEYTHVVEKLSELLVEHMGR